jgi:putative ABC transport system permease protein
MSRDRSRLSWVLLHLLTIAWSRAEAEATVGDIFEELDERTAAGRPPRWRAGWLIAQTFRSLSAELLSATPRLLRSGGHTIRDAARSVRRAPAPTLFMLGILVVGITASTVTFSVVDAVVLKPLPFDHSEELVQVGGRTPRGPTGLSVEEFWAIHDRVPLFDGVGTTSRGYDEIVTVGQVTDRLIVERSTAEFLRLLRLQPVIGRLWTTSEESHGRTDVAIIGYGLWAGRFAKAPDVLGRTVRVFNKSYHVVGVLPAGAGSLDPAEPTAVWVPLEGVRPEPETRAGGFVWALGRLRPGVTIEQARAQVQSALAPLITANPGAYTDWRPEAQPLLDTYVGDALWWLLLLLGAVTLVMLIACVNVANLMLTRSTVRAHEFAIRASLGASRRQLALSLLVESLLLSLSACACALLLSAWGISAAKAALPVHLFRAASIALDGRVLTAAILATFVTGLLFGTVPAWQASRASVVALLKDAGTVTSARRRWRSGFLVAEIACISVLLVASTLFITSFIRVMTLDLGFERSNLLAISTVTHYAGTVDDLKARLGRIGGVTGVAAVTAGMPPLVGPAYGGAYHNTMLQPLGASAGVASLDVDVNKVTSDYFEVAGMPFHRGSTWTASSTASNPMVVDESAAGTLFPGANPIGQRVLAHDQKDTIFTIVGVIPQEFLRGPEVARPTAYYPLDPGTRPFWVGFLLRTSVPPVSLVRTVEASLAEVAPPDPSGGAGVHVVDAAFGRLTATRRFNATLMSIFALFAAIIGAAGIYAVMASIVSQQTREIGVRVALGATTGNIRSGVLGMAGRHLLLGLVIGLPTAWWASRGFASVFFRVHPSDVSIYLIVAAVLVAVGVIGAIIPARRAARVDPIVSLRAS